MLVSGIHFGGGSDWAETFAGKCVSDGRLVEVCSSLVKKTFTASYSKLVRFREEIVMEMFV